MHLPLIKPILRTAGLVVSIIIFALTILSAYGGRFNTEFFTFPAILTLAFQWFAIATIVITAIWICCSGILTGALGVLTIIAVWGPLNSVCPISTAKSAEPDNTTFKVMTWNMIHGWDLESDTDESTTTKRNRSIDYILNSDADIVCLQELKGIDSNSEIPNFTQEQRVALKEKFPYQVGDPSLDMKVLSKYPAIYEKGYNFIDGSFDPKRYTFYILNINGKRVTLINVHLMSFLLSKEERSIFTGIRSVDDAKTSAKEIWKGGISDKLKRGFSKRKTDVKILRSTIERIKGPMIICGDFNDVPESYAYRLLKGDDMKDAYAETGFGPLVTYNRHAFWFHIDQILYRGSLRALNVEKGDIRTSDHYPLIAEFEITD